MIAQIVHVVGWDPFPFTQTAMPNHASSISTMLFSNYCISYYSRPMPEEEKPRPPLYVPPSLHVIGRQALKQKCCAPNPLPAKRRNRNLHQQ